MNWKFAEFAVRYNPTQLAIFACHNAYSYRSSQGERQLVSIAFFEILGLPVKSIEPDRLREVYREQRTAWFLKQFVPEYLSVARKRLKDLEDAYDALRDPRRQKAILRDLKQRQRTGEIKRDAIEADMPAPSPEPIPTVHRPKIVRKLVQIADMIVHRRKRPMSETEVKTLTRIGFKMGLEYPDSAQLVQQIAEEAAQSFRTRTRREELLSGNWPKPEEAR